jgi:hypothetical protein
MSFADREKLIIRDLRCDVKNGQWTISDRVRDSYGKWNDTPQKVIKLRAVTDFANIEVGWFRYVKGEKTRAVNPGPAVSHKLGRKPGDRYKKHIRVLLELADSVDTNEHVRQILTWGLLWKALDSAHTVYQKGVVDHPGMLPIIEGAGFTPVPDSELLQPQLMLVGWAKRPDSLPDEAPHVLLDDDDDGEAAEARASAKLQGRTQDLKLISSNGARRLPDDRDFEDSIPF